MTKIDAILAAGPAISRTKAVPGDNPFNISATAMGMEPVAHRYIGMANSRTISILSNELCANNAKKDSGTNTVIRPAMVVVAN